jgi:hypothetical protein
MKAAGVWTQVMMAVTQMHEDMEEEEGSEAHGGEIDPEWELEKQREVAKAEAEARRLIECRASWKSTSMMDEVKEAVEVRPEWSMLDSKIQ